MTLTVVCPVHELSMIETMQWDLQRMILSCPEPGCKVRYVPGIGQITTDELPSRNGPDKESPLTGAASSGR